MKSFAVVGAFMLLAVVVDAVSLDVDQDSLDASVQVLLEESLTMVRQRQVPASLKRFVNHDKGPMEQLIEREDPKNSLFTDINFFNPEVFDPVYYRDHNAEVRKDLKGDRRIVALRRHWIEFGMRKGLRASANFDAHTYLLKNRDIAHHFGAINYPMAVAHYLRKGVHEKYRETGGPSRIDLYDPRVLDWKWYVDNNPDVKSRGVHDDDTARKHWAKIGLDAGYQASPNIKLSIYLVKNKDLLDAYGPKNYRAALSHWLYRGFNQTWRENGGSTCKFWGTWCQDKLLESVQKSKPSLPRYNPHAGLADPPVPHHGGWSVAINGRTCSDRSKEISLMASSSRVALSTHLDWDGKNEMRACQVTVTHYVDIQTHVEDKTPPELALSKWLWDDSIEPLFLKQPVSSPAGFFYAGYQYGVLPQGSHETKLGTFGDNYIDPRDAMYRISKKRFEDDQGQANAVITLKPTTIYDIHHIYKIDEKAPVYSADIRSPNGSPGTTSEMEYTHVKDSGLLTPAVTPIPTPVKH